MTDPYMLKHAIKTNAIPKETLNAINTMTLMHFNNPSVSDSQSSETMID